MSPHETALGPVARAAAGNARRPSVSFEFSPPKTPEAEVSLWEAIRRLEPLNPSFVSVTYGAGGSTRDRTHRTVVRMLKETTLKPAAHLTCVEASRAEVDEVVQAYWDAGIRHIVALRGDPPKGAAGFQAHPEGFASSVELIEALAATGKFTLRVGAYPEPHPDAADTLADVRWLKRKIDAGASSAITQFFFDADTFFRFRDACAKAGITAPIIPGILPITSWEGAKKFARRCGTSVPQKLDEAFATAARDGREDLLALTQCTQLCDKLIQGGVEDLHFYTLNRPHLTRDVCHALGITPEVALEKVA